MRISSDDDDALVVAHLTGELDASNAAWARERLRTLVSNAHSGLAIDLTGTTYLDSAGISLLFGLATDLRAHQQELRLVVPGESLIAHLLTLAGVTATIRTFPSVDAARAATDRA